MDTDQLYYLETVLGLKNIVMPAQLTGDRAEQEAPASGSTSQAPAASVRGNIKSCQLLTVWGRRDVKASRLINKESTEDPAMQLADKMITAMKVPDGLVVWISWHLENPPLSSGLLHILEAAGSTPILIFGLETAQIFLPAAEIQLGQWIKRGENRIMVTYSPEELLNSNDKKRITWGHLQLVMKEL